MRLIIEYFSSMRLIIEYFSSMQNIRQKSDKESRGEGVYRWFTNVITFGG